MKEWKPQFPIYRDAWIGDQRIIPAKNRSTLQRKWPPRVYAYNETSSLNGVGGNVQRISDMRGQMTSSSQRRAVLVGEYWVIYESFYFAIKVKCQGTRGWTICQYPKY
jgi:hypothetical protein